MEKALLVEELLAVMTRESKGNRQEVKLQQMHWTCLCTVWDHVTHPHKAKISQKDLAKQYKLTIPSSAQLNQNRTWTRGRVAELA